MRDLRPIGKDNILIVDCFSAGDFGDLDIVIDGGKKHFRMHAVLIRLFPTDQPGLPINIHPFQEIQAARIPVIV